MSLVKTVKDKIRIINPLEFNANSLVFRAKEIMRRFSYMKMEVFIPILKNGKISIRKLLREGVIIDIRKVPGNGSFDYTVFFKGNYS